MRKLLSVICVLGLLSCGQNGDIVLSDFDRTTDLTATDSINIEDLDILRGCVKIQSAYHFVMLNVCEASPCY